MFWEGGRKGERESERERARERERGAVGGEERWGVAEERDGETRG